MSSVKYSQVSLYIAMPPKGDNSLLSIEPLKKALALGKGLVQRTPSEGKA